MCRQFTESMEQEETNRKDDRNYHRRSQPGFWLDHTSYFQMHSTYKHKALVICTSCHYGKTYTDCNVDEREAGLALTPASNLVEDEGKPSEEHV